MLLCRPPVGATHAPYSDHVDGNPGILRRDQTGRSDKDERRNQNSFHHAPNPGDPLQHRYKSGRSVTAERGWKRAFDDPIHLPNGRKLLTLGDAGHCVAALPQATQQRPEWPAAAEALLLVAESGGPVIFARIGVMVALNAGKPDPAITPRRKRAKRYRIVR
jgi:hypothetical protein